MSYLEKYSDEELFSIFDSNIEEEIKSRGYEYGWHKKVEYVGDIYVLVNSAFPSLVKIGYADDVPKRVKQLNRSSGLPDPFHVYATYKVKKRLEDLKLHSLIDSLDSDLRHRKNKEFYEMTPEKAYDILSAIAQINGDENLLLKNPYDDDFFKEEFFEEGEKVSDSSAKDDYIVPDGTYYLSRVLRRWDNREVKATAICKDGKWYVQPGSMVCPVYGGGNLEPIKKRRSSVSIVDNILQEELICNSPSGAAEFVLGASADGYHNWRFEDGTRIESVRNK